MFGNGNVQDRNAQRLAPQMPPDREWWQGVARAIESIENYSKASLMGTLWRADAITLTPNQSRTVAHENLQRRRLLIFTDGSNLSGVGLSPGNIINGLGARSGLIVLAPGAPAFEFTHCGEVHALSTSAATLHIVEEFARA